MQADRKHLAIKVTRAKFESLVEDLIERTIEPCRTAIKDAGIKLSDIEDVILVAVRHACPRCRTR
jgi:molecular chaperone DnaK